MTLLHISSSGRLISRSLRVNDTLPPPRTESVESHSSTHLPLPNPFKALRSLSSDHLTDADKEGSFSRLELGDEVDCGEVEASAPVLGLRAHDNGEAVRICAWTAQGMSVCI